MENVACCFMICATVLVVMMVHVNPGLMAKRAEVNVWEYQQMLRAETHESFYEIDRRMRAAREE